MKKLIIFILILTSFLSLSAQTKIDSNGNYYEAKKKDTVINTGKTYTDTKGNVYPVYITSNNKLLIGESILQEMNLKLHIQQKFQLSSGLKLILERQY